MSNQRTKSNKKFMILSAIGIFMVVDSHTFTCFNIFGDFLPYNSFFMPMFVFISGYFNKVDSSTKLWPYFIKKVRTLLVPYTGISLAVFGIQQLINRIKLGDEMPGLPSGYFSYAIDRVLTDGSFAAIATPMWFVISLFATLMVYAILKKLLHRIWNSFLMFALFAALHILVVYFAKNSDPESIKYLLVPLKCMFLMPFLELGVIYRNHIEKKHTAIPVGGKIGLMFALLVINAVRTFYLPNAYDLAFDRINDLSGFYSPYYVTPLISSLVGILFWLTFVDLIAKPVGDSGFVNYMSCNTFWIMGFHILFFNILNCVLMLISTNIVALPFFDIEAFQGSEWYYWEIGSNAKCLYVLAGICGPLFFKWVFDKISSPVRNKYNDKKNASAKSAKILSGIMYALMALIFAVIVITFVSGMRESVSNVSSEYETETAEDFSETFPDDEDGYLQDNITPAYAFLHIVYEDGESYADYFSEFEEVYEDGTYIITVNRSDDPEAELALAGFSYIGIKLIQDDDAEPNISDAIITDISVTCDGEPIVIEDDIETVSGDDGARYIYFDCYDMESDAASLSVTFTVSGTVNKEGSNYL